MYHSEKVMKNLKFKWILTLLTLMLSLIINPVLAKTPDVTNAENRVLSVTRGIVKKLDANIAVYKSNPNKLTALIRNEVLPFIDFEAMSKLTLGKHWRAATKQQRARFINAFREMLIKSYGKSMLKYTGSVIKAGNSTPNRKPGYVTVKTIVTPPGRPPIKANYDVRNKSGSWKAYNIQIAGISLITNFRTNFTREVSAKGLDSLIARLEKNRK